MYSKHIITLEFNSDDSLKKKPSETLQPLVDITQNGNDSINSVDSIAQINYGLSSDSSNALQPWFVECRPHVDSWKEGRCATDAVGNRADQLPAAIFSL